MACEWDDRPSASLAFLLEGHRVFVDRFLPEHVVPWVHGLANSVKIAIAQEIFKVIEQAASVKAE